MSSLIEIGKVVNTRGLRGEVKIYPFVDDKGIFEEIPYILLDKTKYEIKTVKYLKNMVFVTLEGITSVDEAELLKNKVCGIYEDDLPATKEGEYYIKDILGFTVETEDNRVLGSLKDVFKTGSNDVYEVLKEDNKPMYIPAIKDVVKNIDTVNKKITVHLIDGLEDL